MGIKRLLFSFRGPFCLWDIEVGQVQSHALPPPRAYPKLEEGQVNSWSWTLLHTYYCWLEGKQSFCWLHSDCQASRPAEPFRKEVHRKLSSQNKKPQNYQPQIKILLLQKEAVYDCENVRLESGITKIILKTGLDFLLSPTFTVRSRVDSKQAISLQHEVYFHASTFSLCFSCDQRNSYLPRF